MVEVLKNTKIEIEKDRSKVASDMPEMHSHEANEIYFLLSGERRYFVGHTIYDISPGNAVIIPKYELHKTTALNRQGYERYVVYFYDDCIKELYDTLGEKEVERFIGLGCVEFDSDTSEKLKDTLVQMEAERTKNDDYSKAMMQNLLQNMIVTILRRGKEKSRERDADADKIQTVARYIRENYKDNITLEFAAKMAYMENTYFSKRFKALTGFGFNEYITETRMNASEKLLKFSEMSISDISESCGFSSSNYFGDVFKKMNGCSPREYRKKHGIM